MGLVKALSQFLSWVGVRGRLIQDAPCALFTATKAAGAAPFHAAPAKAAWATEERLRLALDSAQMFAWDTDLKTQYTTCSDNAVKLFGFQQGSQETFLEKVLPADRPAVAQAFERALQREETCQMEFRVINPEGQVRWCYSQASLRFDEEGSPICFTGVTLDISDRKRVEAQLHNSQEFNQRIIDSSTDCIKVLDLEGRLLSIDTKGQSRLEICDLSLVLNRPWFEFWQGADREAATQAIAAAQSGQNSRFQGYCPTQTGRPKWWDVVVAPLFDTEGNIKQLLALSRDITDLKQAEQARERAVADLATEQARFEAVLQQMPAGVLITDAASGALVLANQQVEAILGHTFGLRTPAGEPTAAPINFVGFHPDGRPYEKEEWPLARSLRQGEVVVREEIKIQRHDGSRITIEANAAPIRSAADEVVAAVAVFQDISDRKQAEADLKRQKRELRLITDAVPALIAYIDADGRYQYVNRTFTTWFGRAAEDFLGQRMEDCVGTQIYELMRPSVEAALAGELVSTEHWMPFEQGPARYVRRQYIPDRRRNGEVRGFYALINDITDLKQAQEQLLLNEATAQAQAEELEALMEAVPAGIWTAHDPSCHEVSVNQMGYQLMRTEAGSPASVTPANGEPAFHLKLFVQDQELPPQDWPLQKACRTNQEQTGEMEMRFEDGGVTYLYGKTTPLRDEQGQPRGAIGAYVDITALKQAEQGLLKRNQTLSLLSQVASHLLLTEHPKTFIDSLFEQLSSHLDLELYFNYLYNPIQQQLYLHAHRGVPQSVANDLYWLKLGQTVSGTVALSQKPLVIENTQRNQDAITSQVRALGVTAYACYPLLSRGQFIGTLSFGTRTRTHFASDELALMQTVCDQVAAALERSQLLSQLQQRAEELAQANRIKDEFLAVLSHELRSPLNPILGWASLLRRKLTDPSLVKAAETIERNVKLQVQLIEDLLDISRILRGKLNLNLEVVRLENIVNAAIETVSLAAEAKFISLHTHVAPHLSPVMGDAGRLQQIVWNLLSNAIKFTPSGGQVTIRLEPVQAEAGKGSDRESGSQTEDATALPNGSSPPPTALPSPAYVQIIITDTGKGISPDFLPHVFESFRQEDGSTTRQFGGLGLGLAIVRYLLEMHGGTIRADSLGEGQGATFIATLPAVSEAIAPVATQRPSLLSSPESLKQISILVVEDDPDSRTFLTTLLEQSGARITATSSAAEALFALAQNPPDLLISDIGMPDMDGYALIRQIRQQGDEAISKMFAIALTAYASSSDAERALAAGFHQHLAKPVNPEELIRTIVELVQSRLPQQAKTRQPPSTPGPRQRGYLR